MSRIEDLVERVKQGDNDAMVEIIEYLRKGLEINAAKISPHSRAFAEELMANAIGALHKTIPKWNPSRGSFSTFIMTCSKREMLNTLRKERRHGSPLSLSEVGESRILQDEKPTDIEIEDMIGKGKAVDAAVEAASKLSPSQRNLIKMVINKTPIADIADTLGISEDEAVRRMKVAAEYLAFEVQQKLPGHVSELGIVPADNDSAMFSELD